MSKTVLVGIGEMAVSRSAGVVLKTLALGSCVGIVALDPKVKAIGLVHVVLPDSSIDRVHAMNQPAYFVDTAIPALLTKMAQIGSDSRGQGLIIKLVGGAHILDVNGVFDVGKRNVLSCRKLMWQFKLAVSAEDVGSDHSRTVEVFQEDGSVQISCPSKGRWEI